MDPQARVTRRGFAKLAGAAGLAVTLPGTAVAAPRAAKAQGGDRTLHDGEPGRAGFDPARIEDVFARVARRAADGRYPGAVALVARHGIVVGERASGVRLAGSDEAMTTDTLFDLESNTKVLATATMAMQLAEAGTISLDDTVASYLPAFAANGKSAVTIRDMLRYSAGLPVDNNKTDTSDRDAIWAFMLDTALEYPTGTSVEYSDLTYRILGLTLETAAGMDLDAWAKAHIWGPLGMSDTTYNPSPALVPRCAATGQGSFGLRPGPLRGQVQDDQDWLLGGIVGCDGAFSTARDIAVFCQMMLNGGVYGGTRVVSQKSASAMVKNQTPQVSEADTDLDPTLNLILTPKGYGFELWTHRFSPGGMLMSRPSYGKSGGAGTFFFSDPKRDLFAILLTNHGLPVPFDEPGWNHLLDDLGVAEFFDGVITAVKD